MKALKKGLDRFLAGVCIMMKSMMQTPARKRSSPCRSLHHRFHHDGSADRLSGRCALCI